MNDFSDYLSETLSPFAEVKPYSNTDKIHKCSQSHCVIMEDKPWFNDKCKSLHRNYIKCLNVFNRNTCMENYVNVNNAKKKCKLLEAQLKRKYKRQEGNMMEGLRKSNPKWFYSKFGRSHKLSINVSGSEFFDHFKRVASGIHSNMGNSNIEESGEAVNEELDQIISNEEIVLCYI